jgi:hypothetical protein
LTPIKSKGIYVSTAGNELSTVYLSREKLEVLEDNKDSFSIFNIVPVP